MGLNSNNMMMQGGTTNLDNSLLGLDGGNMMAGDHNQHHADVDMNNRSIIGYMDGAANENNNNGGMIDTSLMDLNAAMESPKDELMGNNVVPVQTHQADTSYIDGNAENLSMILQPTEVIGGDGAQNNSIMDA